ncbi:MAG: ABC transporter ATP-binding protein [Verrucomicrobiales bacterium]|nr:ABC transporter ATP-binding protein [Verrucomicrobiales bacterium]
MKQFLAILRFGAPYLRRYRARISLGIVLGIIYGVSNGAALWGARMVFERLSGAVPATPAAAQQEAAIATTGDSGATFSELSSNWRSRTAAVEQAVRSALDDWLPLAGRKPGWREVVGVLTLLPLLMALRGFTGYFSNYFLSWVSERTVSDLRIDIMSRLANLSLEYFSRFRSGDLITRVNTDALTLQVAIGSRMADLVKEPVTILSILGLLILLDPKLTFFVLIFLPICVIPIGRLGKKARAAGRGMATASSQQAGLMVEFLAGIRVVKAFGLEATQLERFQKLARELVSQGMRAMRARELVNPIIELVSALALSTLVLYIAFQGIQFTDLLTFLGGTAILYTPIKRLSQVHVSFVQASVAAERIGQILAEQPTVVDPSSPKTLTAFRREIVFDGVTFAYNDRTVLNDFSLVIPCGQKLGVAGESGAGKSTLVNLLFRFYDPQSGRITIDGVDLRDQLGRDLRRLLALVSQDIVIFDLTVAENIACGRPGVSRAEVEAAARAAFAHDFISALPKGYDTSVGERGVTLSGGQRQRLSIARAFVRNSPILILDEATASLDSQSEREVQSAIERLEENRTVLCVAHRLSTLMGMDRVITLSAGRIVESGPPQELLRQDGPFASMARLQGILPS